MTALTEKQIERVVEFIVSATRVGNPGVATITQGEARMIARALAKALELPEAFHLPSCERHEPAMKIYEDNWDRYVAAVREITGEP